MNPLDIKGLMHIHSSYSYDGKVALQQLVDLCRSQGYRFIALTEHAISMNEAKMKMLVSECVTLSRNDLVIIPGLEFECDGDIHILALGIEEYIPISHPKEIIHEIHKLGGVAILAHVSYYDRIPYEALYDLDGIEIWNVKYDGKYAPRLKNFAILKKFKERNPNIICYGGLDFHKIQEFRKLSVSINIGTKNVNGKEVLTALKEGNFYITNGLISIEPLKNQHNIRFIIIIFVFLSDILRFGKMLGRKIFKATDTKPPKILQDLIQRFL